MAVHCISNNKYSAKKATRSVAGEVYKFDSQAEARYFDKLVNDLKYGNITELKTQPTYGISNAYKIDTTKTQSGKSKIGTMKYTPDFEYIKDGKRVAVEVKGKVTADYRMRLKLFLAIAHKNHGVNEFIEVVKGVETVYYCDTVRTA